MKKIAAVLVVLAIAAAVIFWLLTMPSRLPSDAVAGMESGDAARGERIFWAGGCASCHAAKGATGDALLQLGGGLELATPFGTFHAPNISPDTATGIGGWSGADFANAMMKGVAPDGAHYYPAFPYTSYARMAVPDVADLWAFMKTLPPVAQQSLAHDLPLPFRLRRGLGLWKHLFLSGEPVVALAAPDERLVLGRYLVEGPGHCAECHTPRNLIGGPERSRWLAGGPAAEGTGVIPNITPAGKNLADWSESDIVNYLETGFTPDYDSVGGSMVAVQRNMARLRPEDRAAIAAYLKAVPAVR